MALQSCHKQIAPLSSMRLSPAPVIDGDITDWGVNFATTNPELQCFVANDSQNLYVAVRIQDEATQLKAMRLGMTIWVDTLGKQQHHRGIGFPLETTDAQWTEWGEKGKGDIIEVKNLYAKNCQEFDLVGFVEESLRVTNFTSRDMKVGARLDALRAMVYEIKVPIRQIIKRDWTANGVIAVHAKINDLKPNVDDDTNTFNDPNANSITQSNPLMGGMGNPNGMMGNPNGMMGGNPNGMSNPNLMANSSGRRMMPNNSMPNIWVKVQLAK